MARGWKGRLSPPLAKAICQTQFVGSWASPRRFPGKDPCESFGRAAVKVKFGAEDCGGVAPSLDALPIIKEARVDRHVMEGFTPLAGELGLEIYYSLTAPQLDQPTYDAILTVDYISYP